MATHITGYVGNSREKIDRAMQATGILHWTASTKGPARYSDQARVLRTDGRIIKTQLFEHTGRKVIDHHIDHTGKAAYQVAPGLGGQVNGDTLFTAVE